MIEISAPDSEINLLLNHAHTPYSNPSSRDRACDNHNVNYLEVLEKAPEEAGIVAVRTEHYYSDPEYFDELEEETKERGGYLERFDKHVVGEAHDKPFAIVNGCEVSVEQENWHFLVGGLDLDYDKRNQEISRDELYRIGEEDAEWIAPAHYQMPGFVIPPEYIEELFEKAKDSDFEVAVNIPTGYSPFINNMGRGTMNRLGNRFEGTVYGDIGEEIGMAPGRTLKDWAEEYDIPMVPELDAHSILPAKFEGAGVLKDDEIMEKLFDGDLPVESLLDTYVVSYNGRSGGFSLHGEGMTHFEFFQTLPGTLNKFGDIYDRLIQYLSIFPCSEEEFRELWEEKSEKLEGASVKEIKRNSHKFKNFLI